MDNERVEAPLAEIAENKINVNENLHNTLVSDDTDADIEANASASEEAQNEPEDEDAVDYAELVRSDIRELSSEFPELIGLSDIRELKNPIRYAELRDLGLTPAEAYLASARQKRSDNRAHLYATRTVSAGKRQGMTEAEIHTARDIFTGLSDAEIRSLYKRVTSR